MDPPYQPANITFDNNSNFNPNFDNANGNGNINNDNNNINNNINNNNNNINTNMNSTGNNESNNNNNTNQMASGSSSNNGQGNSMNGIPMQMQMPIPMQMQNQNQNQMQNQNQNGYQYQQSPNGYPQNQNGFQPPMGPPTGPPPPMQYQNSGNNYQYHSRNPSVQYNHNRDQSNMSGQSTNLSDQSTRTNTWVQTPAGPFPPQFQQPAPTGYFPGPVDANGYPIDVKGKQPYIVEEHSVQSTPAESRRASMDMEKQKAEVHAAEPHDPHKKDPNQPVLPWGQRLKHFTWAWYTLTMATGGISTLIAIQPHAFKGLISIGAVFYVVNLIFFAILNTCMVLRFTKFPGMFKESIKHEREALFLGPFFLSIATIITGTQKYVVESYEADHPVRGWIITSMAIVFWIYVFMTFCLAVFQYSFLFCAHTYPLMKFMPSWLLPIFPIMLAGTIASVIAKDQPISSRMPILAAGMGCQGLGFTVSILMYAHYIGRLMQAGYPNREHRGAMFIGVGPPSFTCLAFIGMANALPDDFDLQGDGFVDANMLRTMAIVSALFLWVLAMWFFMIALIAVLHSRPEYFHLGWWAMVFPNSGFIIATISIGNSLKDETILFVGNGLTIAVLCMWVFVLYHNIRAVIVADIMYPGRDEDVED